MEDRFADEVFGIDDMIDLVLLDITFSDEAAFMVMLAGTTEEVYAFAEIGYTLAENSVAPIAVKQIAHKRPKTAIICFLYIVIQSFFYSSLVDDVASEEIAAEEIAVEVTFLEDVAFDEVFLELVFFELVFFELVFLELVYFDEEYLLDMVDAS